jgi:Gram positive anchor.
VAAVRDAGSPIDRRQLSGSAGDQGTANKKPNKVTGGQNAGAVNNGGSAATGQPGMTAAVTTGGHAAKVDLAANTAKQPAQATSKDASDQLPQTNEQANNGLAVVGLALLGALAGVRLAGRSVGINEVSAE